MIYVDTTQLFRFIKMGKPVTGIQRLTLVSLMGMDEQLGASKVAPMVFSKEHGVFTTGSIKALFAGNLAGFKPVVFTTRDQLLFMEWFFDSQVLEASLTAGKVEGAKAYRFMHDVIPVARPDLVKVYLTRRFRDNTSRALAAADHILTNSDFSRADLLKHFPTECAGKSVDVVKLQHEFIIVRDDGGVQRLDRKEDIVAEDLRPAIQALAGQKFSMMVGTLEPRKNSLEVVKAWARLARRHGSETPKLVVVGFYSAHKFIYTGSLVARMWLNKTFVHLDDCSDAELAWLYQHCLFGIYASQYEGWGLPIGESLWFGKPVLTQNVSSLPEVGGALADYADVRDKMGFMSALEKLAFDADYRQRRSAEIFKAKLRDCAAFAKELARSLAA